MNGIQISSAAFSIKTSFVAVETADDKKTARFFLSPDCKREILPATHMTQCVVDFSLLGLQQHSDLSHKMPPTLSQHCSLRPERQRLLIYALWDMCTGSYLSRYCVARGESAVDALDFLCWALAEKDDARVMHGVPDDLWSDQGPLFKSAAAQDLLKRLDISLVTGAPYSKERIGGVERCHRTRWQRFERALMPPSSCPN